MKNIKKSKLLKVVYMRLLSGDNPDWQFLCIEISKAHYHLYGSYNEGGTDTVIRDWIMNLMQFSDDSSTYNDWMEIHHPRLHKRMSHDDFQHARLQWLKWMITYWEEQGE